VQQLADALRDATDGAPPSTIDLDHLIVGEQRRRRVRTGVGAVLVTAALAAVPLALTTGGGATAPPTYGTAGSPVASRVARSSPPGDADPATRIPDAQVSDGPRHPDAVHAANLTRAVLQRIDAMLPAATFTDPRTGDPTLSFRGTDALGYDASVTVQDAAGVGHVTLNYLLRFPTCADGTTCESPPACPHAGGDTTCTVLADGTKVLVIRLSDGAFRHHQVALYRPGGAIVQVSANNGTAPQGAEKAPTVTRPEPPLTVDQLTEIADLMRLPG
jgi:hypothetical protein